MMQVILISCYVTNYTSYNDNLSHKKLCIYNSVTFLSILHDTIYSGKLSRKTLCKYIFVTSKKFAELFFLISLTGCDEVVS